MYVLQRKVTLMQLKAYRHHSLGRSNTLCRGLCRRCILNVNFSQIFVERFAQPKLSNGLDRETWIDIHLIFEQIISKSWSWLTAVPDKTHDEYSFPDLILVWCAATILIIHSLSSLINYPVSVHCIEKQQRRKDFVISDFGSKIQSSNETRQGARFDIKIVIWILLVLIYRCISQKIIFPKTLWRKSEMAKLSSNGKKHQNVVEPKMLLKHSIRYQSIPPFSFLMISAKQLWS